MQLEKDIEMNEGADNYIENGEQDLHCPVCYEELYQVSSIHASDIPSATIESDKVEHQSTTAVQRLPLLPLRQVRLQACQHIFCRPCVQDYCTFTITSTRRVPIQCPMSKPRCDNHLTENEVRAALMPEQDTSYVLYTRLERLYHDPSLTACPSCDELVTGPSKVGLEASAGGPEDATDSDATEHERDDHQQIHDPNRRTCLNPACFQTIFCILHGPLHVDQSCHDYMTSREAAQQHLSLQSLDRYTKPCPRCGAAIHKASGCNHVVCPMCQGDFCFKCGTHEHLTSPAAAGGGGGGTDPVFRSCAKCQQTYIDHRYQRQFQKRLCCMLPLLLPGWIIYSIVLLLVCLLTCCFGCCFGCGTFSDPDAYEDDDIEANAERPTAPSRKGEFAPCKAVMQGISVVLLPFIGALRQFGIPCRCFPDSLPGEKGEEQEIPSLTVTESDEWSGNK
jgi:hypothetical protein